MSHTSALLRFLGVLVLTLGIGASAQALNRCDFRLLDQNGVSHEL